MAAKPICSIPDCGKAPEKRGWCSAHYHRWRKHGDPLVGGPLRERTANGEPWRYFEEEVLPFKGNDCLIWPYAKTKGYGVLNKTRYVHRLVCESVHGPAPTPEHEAAHSCGKGHLGCVTKRHLSWKTSTENKADQLVHGTRNRGARNGSAKLTTDNVRAIRELQGKLTQSAIARQFGTGQQAISEIQLRKRWAWLD